MREVDALRGPASSSLPTRQWHHRRSFFVFAAISIAPVGQTWCFTLNVVVIVSFRLSSGLLYP